MKRKLMMLLGFLSWACCSLALAAEPNREALRACVAEKDEGLRLACYDRELQSLVAQPAAPEPPPEPDVQEDKFGARGGEMARKQARAEEKTAIKEVVARITSLGQRPRGERVFTLDNGQVWVEKRRESYLPVEVGETVTIVAGALSSYRLSEASGRSTQVQRVQ